MGIQITEPDYKPEEDLIIPMEIKFLPIELKSYIIDRYLNNRLFSKKDEEYLTNLYKELNMNIPKSHYKLMFNSVMNEFRPKGWKYHCIDCLKTRLDMKLYGKEYKSL